MTKTKVVLFHPRTFHEKNYRNFWIPYSVLSIGSQLSKQEYSVEIIDNNLERQEPAEIVSALNNVDLVGISAMIGYQIKEGLDFATAVKEKFPKVPIIFGGAAPTILPIQFLEYKNVDFVVRGQGEMTFLELTGAIKEKRNLENILGISFKDNNNRAIHTDSRKPIKRDFFLPYDYSLINPSKYIREDEHVSNRVLNYVSSQGCSFNCGFCSEIALYKKVWAVEPLERTLLAIKELVEKHGVNGIKFYDANFFINKERVLLFAEEVKKWNIKWAASAHPKNLLTLSEEELRIISESGCSRVLIGAESGNEEELAYIKKGVKTDDILEVAKKLGRIGIHGSFTIIVGYPGFPEENIERTLEFGKQIASVSHLHEVKAHIYAPYPGTPLYLDAIAQGFSPPKTLEEWAYYDYYEVQTPWVKPDVAKKIRNFNLNYCPYVL